MPLPPARMIPFIDETFCLRSTAATSRVDDLWQGRRASLAGERRALRSSFEQSSREFAGRLAGVGYSAVVIRRTRATGPPAQPKRRRSPRRSRPSSRPPRRSCGRCRAAFGLICDTRFAATARTPSAMSSALVGLPTLVGDDGDFVAVVGEAQHGLDEIGAERAVDPRRAQESRDVAMAGQDGLLARPASTRHRRSVGPVGSVSTYGRSLRPVEHVVGRQVDERHSKLARGLRDRAGAALVDREGKLALRSPPCRRRYRRRPRRSRPGETAVRALHDLARLRPARSSSGRPTATIS